MRIDQIAIFSAGVVFSALGLTLTPDLLLSIDILTGSLTHATEMVREVTLLEIQVARWSLTLIGIGLCILSLLLPHLSARPAVRAYIDAPLPTLPEQSFFDRSGMTILAMLALFLVIIWYAPSVLNPSMLRDIVSEDGVIETLSAFIILCAAGVSFWIAYRVGVRGRGFGMHIFLGFLFFLMCGEEISWGQRYFGLQTPEAIRAVNVQAEINFHNMFGYFFDHLFILAIAIWFMLMPVLAWSNRFCRQLFYRVGLPIPSLGLSLAMVLVYVVFIFAPDQLGVTRASRWLRPEELREALSLMAMLLLMLQRASSLNDAGGVSSRSAAGARTATGIPK